jgi:large subunit ribosomal protein L29
MKSSELRARPATELKAELLKLRKEQFALRLQRATGQAVKPDQFGKVRHSIARVKTALRAGELGLPVGGQGASAGAAAKPAKAAKLAKAAAVAKPAAKKAAGKKAAGKSAKKTGAQ